MAGKELFNQTLKQELSLTDRFAVGIPNLEGCDNILLSDIIRYTGLTLIKRFASVSTVQTFTPDVRCKILSIDFKHESGGTATISANCGDEDLVPSMGLTSGAYAENTIMKSYSNPISLNVSDGTVTIVVLYIRNPY
jgi:hypothetical protein